MGQFAKAILIQMILEHLYRYMRTTPSYFIKLFSDFEKTHAHSARLAKEVITMDYITMEMSTCHATAHKRKGWSLDQVV